RTQYKPCDKCTKHEKGDFSCVYIAKEGESYHTDLGCSGLKRTVKQVDLSTLKGMRPCMRCAKQGDT
ncbi:pilus assembly protein, partial [Anaerostipes hadrus]|nr:pilus assembly protein [Anaerostipes hadrus]